MWRPQKKNDTLLVFLNCFQLFLFPEEQLGKALPIRVHKGNTWGLAQTPELCSSFQSGFCWAMSGDTGVQWIELWEKAAVAAASFTA